MQEPLNYQDLIILLKKAAARERKFYTVYETQKIVPQLKHPQSFKLQSKL
jgi:hypothetical protein